MNNNKISTFQFACLLTLIIHAPFFGGLSSTLFSLGGQDLVIVMLFSTLISGVFGLLVWRIAKCRPDLGLFPKINAMLGKHLGFIVSAIVGGLFLLLLLQSLISLSDFILVIYLPHTPLFIIAGVIALTIGYGVNCGIEAICRLGPIVLFSSLLAFLFLALSSGQIDTDNFLPALTLPLPTIVQATMVLSAIICLPLTAVLLIPLNDVKNNGYKKGLIIGIVGGLLLIILDIVFTIGFLGIELTTLYLHPEYYVLKKVHLFAVIKNIETLLSVRWIIDTILVAIVATKVSKRAFASLSRCREATIRKVTYIILALMLALVVTIYRPNLIQRYDLQMVYCYLVFGATALILVILSLASLGKTRTVRE